MADFENYVGIDEPAEYILQIQGRLDWQGSDWFQGEYRVTQETGGQSGPVTRLQGVVADQAALHGLLTYIRDLGLSLLYVDCLSARKGEMKDE